MTELTYARLPLVIEEAILGDLSAGNYKTIRTCVSNEQGCLRRSDLNSASKSRTPRFHFP
jgi:hypothetical protein